MNKTNLFILFILLLLITASCSKDYDTRLRGKWQMRYETNSTGSHEVDSVYYSFDNHIFQVQFTTHYVAKDDFTHLPFMDNCVGVFYQNDDSLQLRFVDSVFIKKAVAYPSLGWKTSSRTLFIQEITTSQLILSDKNVKYVFRKF